MPAFERVLGPGTKESTATTSNPRDLPGTLVMTRNAATGSTAFRLILEGIPGYVPTGASVTRLDVIGMGGLGCTGGAVCTKGILLPAPVPFGPPTVTAGGDYDFDPGGHDAGVLSAAMAVCGCATLRVESVRVEADVTLVPPPPAPGNPLLFAFCLPCAVIEIAGKDRPAQSPSSASGVC
jgi:hypothetical protein